MKKVERIEGNKLFLKNNGFEYDEKNKIYYRTYGNNSKPIYISEQKLVMSYKEFDSLIEKLRVEAINFRNITIDDMYELDKTMEKINKKVAEKKQLEHQDKSIEQSFNMIIRDMSVQELEKLKTEIEKALKEKGAKKTRKPKDPDKRKPSLRIRKSTYVEIYYRDIKGKLICKYLGKICDAATEKKLEEFGKPELFEEYRQLKNNWKNHDL